MNSQSIGNNDVAVQNEQNDAIDSEKEDEEDHLAPFQKIIDALHFEKVALLALHVRESIAEPQAQNKEQNQGQLSSNLPTTDHLPMTGSYHILFPITFPDQVQWLLKVPRAGTKDSWNAGAAAALASEAHTMRFVSSKTTIPVPEVYYFSAEIDSELGAPFILMEYVTDAKSLFDVWFDDKRSAEETEAVRKQALRDIAEAMFQLSDFRFGQGGSLEFDEMGNLKGVGKRRIVNRHADVLRFDEDGELLADDDEEHEPIFIHEGPFNNWQSYYTKDIPHWTLPTASGPQGTFAFLKLILSWLPEAPLSLKTPFVLMHPDYDIQNFLVSKNGHLRAVIDWDSVSTVPMTLGPCLYPGWLTRDWDPMMYNPPFEGEDQSLRTGCPEDSPETLQFYRGFWLEMVSEHAMRHAEAAGGNAGASSGGQVNVRATRQSIVFENLAIAAYDEICTAGILSNLLTRMVWASDDEWIQNLQYGSLTQSFAEGTLGEEDVERLRLAFEQLLNTDDTAVL